MCCCCRRASVAEVALVAGGAQEGDFAAMAAETALWPESSSAIAGALLNSAGVGTCSAASGAAEDMFSSGPGSCCC